MDNSIYWLISLRIQNKDFNIEYTDWIFETGSQSKILEVTELANTYIQNHIPYEKFAILWVKDLRVMWQISLRKQVR